MSLMRRYIDLCKKKVPTVPVELTEFLVDSYVDLRKDSRNNGDTTFTSARNLLAILRLSTALAKLRLSDLVEREDVVEAMRLLEMSKISLMQVDEVIGRYVDIFFYIKNYCKISTFIFQNESCCGPYIQCNTRISWKSYCC